MAEYIVSLLVEKIATQLVEEAASLSSVRSQIEWIDRELRRMQCFLRDAEAKQDVDERVKNWVADVRDVAYETSDVIDNYILKIAQRRKTEKGMLMFFKRYAFISDEFIARRKIHKNISRIRMKIQDISTSRSTYGIENLGKGNGGGQGSTVGLQERRRSYPHVFEDDIIGLVEDVNMLEAQLVHGEERRSVISIIGMAGLGKTTLAKKLYHSNEVKESFDCSAWVYVSQEYRVKEILQDLCKQVKGLVKTESRKMNREDLVEELLEVLVERKYLIVLDDIWKNEVWDDLRAAFPDTNNGSRIIFTTRFKDVALHADPRSPPHELSLLNDEDSWRLFSKKVCLEWNPITALPPWSLELGKQILKKCGGLPLAIVVLGGLLSRKEATYSEWLKVLQSVHWQLTQDSTQCLDILALSYHELPYYLKSCFLYFGLFPEDFEISARRLVLLWVAEGLIHPRGLEPLEDIAEDYMEELAGRSMIQAAKRKSNGKIKTIRLHDLLRELSISKAKEDRFLDVIYSDVKASSITNARRLAIHFEIPNVRKDATNFRSFLFFDLAKPLTKEMKKFKLLQVVDLEGILMTKLDGIIGNLILLKYLGLRGTWLKKLPNSMSNLVNLQTLDLRSTLIDPIPVAVWKMKQLRHLYTNEFIEIIKAPPPAASLANLQTLMGICITKSSLVENGLDNATNLSELGVHGDLLCQEESLCRWISKLGGLKCLKLHSGASGGPPAAGGEIPSKLNFSGHLHLSKLHLRGFIDKFFCIEELPRNLTELSLRATCLMEDPMEKLEKLPSLRVLKLRQSSYLGKEIVCNNGGFAQLQFLRLSFLYSLETWKIEDGAMRNLRHLEIIECQRMKIVPGGLRPLKSLSNLKLGYMPHNFETLVQDFKGENWYRIEHVLPTVEN